MLQAVLHGKLKEAIVEPQRLEDALTSTVFGTLVWLDEWDVLARWLRVPFDSSGPNDELPSRECWFWPRMAFAEPDVVLRLGNTLVMVEAKYRSGRHDVIAANDGDEDLCDQLVRQYRSVTQPIPARVCYAEPIERAIRECRLVQVFVVDARRLRHARREWEQSRGRLPTDVTLQLVTWQALFRMLNAETIANRRWAADLRGYFQLSGLDTFGGISRRLVSIEDCQRIDRWRLLLDIARLTIRLAVTLEPPQVAALKRWRSSELPETQSSFCALDPGILDGRAQTAILAWCAPKPDAIRSAAKSALGKRGYHQ